MRKLALIGKDIQHSKSPEIYKRLISPLINYELLDYKCENDIPSALDLFSLYEGINITSPYKKHFLTEVTLSENAKTLGAINCLRLKDGVVQGENTDFLAILDILSELKEKYIELDVVILGDGVMSVVTQVALKKLTLEYQVCSRKKTYNFDQLNLLKILGHERTPLLINTCSREFIFNGNIPKESIFWDFNYSFTPHATSLPHRVHLYFDGLSMLEKQAEYAVSFWSGT